MDKMATRDDLLKAFVEVLDGSSSWWDIQAFTGLPDERCKELNDLFVKACAEVYKK